MGLNIDYMILIGIFLIMTSLFYFLYCLIAFIKDNKRFNGKFLYKKIKYYNKTNQIISQISLLNNLKEKLQLKYGVINSSTEKQNENKAIKTILNMTILSSFLSILAILVIKIWYLIIPIVASLFVLPYVILFVILNAKLLKLKGQFANALNVFITKYTSDRNKDRALQRTYPELQYPMKYEIMRLSRSMANKSNIKKSIKNFSRRVNYLWAEVFGELLIMNHTTVSDIGDELNELNLIMLEDQAIEAEKLSEMNSDKIINLIVAFYGILVIVVNIFVFKGEAMNIYFGRYIGIVGISLTVIIIVLCTTLTFYFVKK